MQDDPREGLTVACYFVCAAALALALGLGALCLWMLPVFMEAIRGR